MKQKQVLLVCPVALALVGALLGCGGGSANPAATPTPVATPTPAPAATYTLVPLSTVRTIS